MRSLSTTTAVLFVLASGFLAQGQGPGVTPERAREVLNRLDANKDGRIEKDEVPEGQRGLFDFLIGIADANKNGVIDADERPAVIEHARKQAAGKGAVDQGKAVAEMLRRMDKDGDGKVSRAEFTSHADYFDRLDANKDGFLVASEIPSGATMLLNKDLPHVPLPRPSTGLVPLTELKAGTYKEKEGGLYTGGVNNRPAAHEQAGLALARTVRSLDAEGKAAAGGKVVLLSIGMSNTTQEFSTFMELARDETGKNPSLVIVDGAQGGRTAAVVSRPDSPPGKQFWETVDQRLKQAGVTREQVQVAWMKQADGGPNSGFPAYATTLESEMLKIAQILKERFPNLSLLYLSSRIYGGYATTPLNPEPYAYESAFSVKWLIEKQLSGDPALNFDPTRGPVKSPWLSWGPYLWADGTRARDDGLTYLAADFGGDGTHPAMPGRRKVARQLLDFFKTDSTARIWFLKSGD
jgi:hypothetical protein